LSPRRYAANTDCWCGDKGRFADILIEYIFDVYGVFNFTSEHEGAAPPTYIPATANPGYAGVKLLGQ
jgi:hypothetical protein